MQTLRHAFLKRHEMQMKLLNHFSFCEPLRSKLFGLIAILKDPLLICSNLCYVLFFALAVAFITLAMYSVAVVINAERTIK